MVFCSNELDSIIWIQVQNFPTSTRNRRLPMNFSVLNWVTYSMWTDLVLKHTNVYFHFTAISIICIFIKNGRLLSMVVFKNGYVNSTLLLGRLSIKYELPDGFTLNVFVNRKDWHFLIIRLLVSIHLYRKMDPMLWANNFNWYDRFSLKMLYRSRPDHKNTS